MSDIWNAMAQGMAFGRNWREQNVAEQKKNRLAELAQGVFQNDPRATQEAYSIDPRTAQAYEQGADRQHGIFKNLAMQLKQAATPDLRARIYAMYAPQIKQLVPQAPDTWDESWYPMLDQWIGQAGYLDEGRGGQPAGVQEFNYLTQGFSPEEVAAARRTKLGLAPRAALPQIREGAGGIYGIDRANYSAAPIMLGGGQPAPSGLTRLPSGQQIKIDPSMSEYERNLVMQNAPALEQGGDSRGPPMVQGGQMQAPEKAVKDRNPSELEIRLALAKQVGATPDDIKRIVLGSADPRANTAATQKTVQAAKVKLQSLGPLRRQLDTVRDLFDKLKNSASAGGFGQGYLPTESGQAFDRAVAQLAPLVRQLTRVPGEGAMSDYESRLATAALPDRTNYESTTAQQIQGLYDLIDSIEQGYSGLLSESGAQGNGSTPDNSDPLGIR